MNVKKYLWSSAIVFLSTIAMAQEMSTDTFGPSKGDLSTEVQFNPLSNSKNSFQLDALKLRYFLSDNSAVRINFGLGVKSITDYEPGEKEYTKVSNSNWSIDWGYEKHHSIAPRMDIYFGYGLGIQKDTEKKEMTSVSYVGTKDEKETEKSGNFGFRASAFTGFDFYVYRGLYLGTELGLRFTRTKKGETSKKSNTQAYSEKIKEPDTDIAFGFFVTPAMRLGWTF